ncbi:MAG: hypothetical protein INF92_15925 [Rhodobacter sp.]|nr:hypothetical protein [Rhodobacter sp.]
MIRPVLRFLGRWVRRLLKGPFWLVAAYPFLLVLMYYTKNATFPNGAVLSRNFDWQKGSRGDLYTANGVLIARDVDLLSWNEMAITGIGERQRFIWLSGEHDPVYGSDPRFAAAEMASGLVKPQQSGCGGTIKPFVNAEFVLTNLRPMRAQDRR